MASCSPFTDPTGPGLYVDTSTHCSYNYNQTNFTRIPEKTLALIQSGSNCTWLASIINGRYSTQRVWRGLLPAAVYKTNFTNCYGEQYMDYFKLSPADDCDYSSSRDWLIPRGLSSVAESCITNACRRSGATGNPDLAGIGVSFFVLRKCLSAPEDICREITNSDTDAGCIRVRVILHNCILFIAAHRRA